MAARTRSMLTGLLVLLSLGGGTPSAQAEPFFEAARLTAADGSANDFLGSRVAVSGDTLVAGAAGDDGGRGAAYVFRRTTGDWADAEQVAKLTAAGVGASHEFGRSVAIEGDTIVVGAAPTGERAYVFVKPAGGWQDATQSATLAVAGTGTFFGISVAIRGDVVAVGATADGTGGATGEGAVHVFERPLAGWSGTPARSAILISSGGEAEDFLGASVAVADTFIAAGRPGDDVGVSPNVVQDVGSVAVFEKPAATWSSAQPVTEEQNLFGTTAAAAGQRVGESVTTDGTLVVAGAPSAPVSGDAGQGAAFLWTGIPGTFGELGRLTVADGAAQDGFGSAAALAGGRLAIGALRAGSSGAVYVFADGGAGWLTGSQIGKLATADGAPGDFFGGSVGISGTAVVVGAGSDDIGTAMNQGSVSVFQSDAVAPLAPQLAATSPASPANENSPLVVGSAEPRSLVRVYTVPGCSGPVVAQGPAASFAAPGLPAPTADNSTTSFSATATDRAGNLSPCSSEALTYVEDSAPPLTPVISGPAAVVAGSGTVRYTAVADDTAGGSGVAPEAVRWTADGGLPAVTGSVADYVFATPATYTLSVSATDRAGNVASPGTLAVVAGVAPAVDADGDGVLATQDCNDADKTIRPGAVDVPADGIDQNCDGQDARRRIESPIVNKWAFSKTFAIAIELRVRRVPKTGTVTVRCSGPRAPRAQRRTRGCPYTSRKFKPTRSGKVNLVKPFRGRRLGIGSVIEIRILAPGAIGKVVRYKVVRNKVPVATRLCLPPAAPAPKPC